MARDGSMYYDTLTLVICQLQFLLIDATTLLSLFKSFSFALWFYNTFSLFLSYFDIAVSRHCHLVCLSNVSQLLNSVFLS